MAAIQHPARLVVAGFAATVAVGTVLLSLPAAAERGHGAGFVDALFTATSAVCVTGLIVVDTPGHWSLFGETVILALIQIGGFGIMTLASLLGLVTARRLRLRMQLTAQAETKSLGLGEVRHVVVGVAKTSLLFEAATAGVLAARLWAGYGQPPGRAVYLGVFHAVSAFNNAGFALYSDSLGRFAGDPWILLPIAAAVIAGGLGFPVWLELRRRARMPRHWSLHVKVTVAMTVVLLSVSTVLVTMSEWNNPATLGRLGVPGRLLAGFFQAVMTRSGGFNTIDIGAMEPATLLAMDVFMFIGAGSAGTGGGIKVTTFALLAFVILTEVRGERDVHVLGRRLPAGVQRQALAVALLSVAAVMVGTFTLLVITPFGLDRVLFESVSAFATVGLSTGITAELPATGQLLLVVLMFAGRLGPITLASALALRERPRRYQFPEERPIVG